MSEPSRLDALELSVARLTRDLVALRAEVRTLRDAALANGEKPATDAQAPDAWAMGARTDATGTHEPRASGTGQVEGLAPGAHLSADTSGASDAGGTADAVPPGSTPFVSDELRRMVAATAPSAAAAAGAGRRTRGAAHASTSRLPAWRDVEGFIGRYGTLALATITILMAVGAFLGWAIRNGYLGPELRVALGALAAGGVGALGWWLRRGDSPRFGNVVLALALAILHVDAWGAGPLLQVVPGWLALAVAGASSAALAALALRHEDQALFNVGFGGALLAPFVASGGDGDGVLLLVYGAVVMVAAMRALGERVWTRTPLVLGVGIAWYTAAAAGVLHREVPWPRATAPVIFALGMAWLALLTVRGDPKRRVAWVACLAALGALMTLHREPSADWPRWFLAAMLTLTAYAVGDGTRRQWENALLGGVLIPAGASMVALSIFDNAWHVPGGGTAALWGAAAATAAYVNRDGERNAHAFLATLFGMVAIALLSEQRVVPFIVSLAAYCAAASWLLRTTRLTGMVAGIAVSLVIATIAAFAQLGNRTWFAYRPFLTKESAAGAAVAAAWLVFSYQAARAALPGSMLSRSALNQALRVVGGVVTFFWIHAELAGAFSPDVATFLLVAYYAVSGIVAIGVGRARGLPMLRQAGLALSVFAALKAIWESSSLAIGWRVAAYLMAGVFLLGVAWWYRGRRGGGEGGAGAGDGDEGREGV